MYLKSWKTTHGFKLSSASSKVLPSRVDNNQLKVKRKDLLVPLNDGS